LHESLGQIIMMELKTGQLYQAEDNLNFSLKDSITVTWRDVCISQLGHVYIRKSMDWFFIVFDMLQNSTMQVT
ncbi:hypothetical protein B0H17DRAFT_939212, partial [Mycena rosella]